MDRSAPPSLSAERGAIVGFEVRVGSIGEARLRQNDNVQTWARLVVTVQLARKTLRPVASDGPAEPPGGHDAESTHVEVIREDDDRHVPPTRPDAPLLDPEKVGTPPEALAVGQTLGHTKP